MIDPGMLGEFAAPAKVPCRRCGRPLRTLGATCALCLNQRYREEFHEQQSADKPGE